MRIFLSLVGIVMSFLMVKYRERLGDTIGEGEWMRQIGGVYMVIIYIAIFIFFWSVAEITGTTTFLFGLLRKLSPGFAPPPEPI